MSNMTPEEYNLCRPKYSELDIQKLKDEHAEGLRAMTERYESHIKYLEELSTIRMAGENMAVFMQPNAFGFGLGFELVMQLRDVKFNITKIDCYQHENPALTRILMKVEAKDPESGHNLLELLRKPVEAYYSKDLKGRLEDYQE